MGILHDTTVAVRDLLAAGSFTLDIDPRVSYDVQAELDELDTLRVDVVAAGLLQRSSSRISVEYNAQIDIGVRYRFGVVQQVPSEQAIDVEEIGVYVDLLEELAEYLADADNRALSTTEKGSWLANDIRVPWVPEHIRQHRQYTGIVRATYFVEKEL